MMALVRFIFELSLYATDNPPASSAALLIRLPVDKRSKLLRKASLARVRLNDDAVAVALEFTTTGILYLP
jgi:hypothetical protein